MFLLDENTAANYLRKQQRIDSGERVVVRELAGGVSNMVLLVERPEHAGQDFVLKQGREQLRTAMPWFASLERVWRESEVLRVCHTLLAQDERRRASVEASVPAILFEDRENYVFAMTPVPRPHATWKAELLAGETDSRVAFAAGKLLGSLHAGSWRDRALEESFGDRSLFDALRIDPYYRTLAGHRQDARAGISRLLASLEANCCALVHADFSPKNLLHSEGRLTLVDFETGHFGDPAFDLGFFLSHLILKACLKQPDHERYLALTQTFRQSYDKTMRTRLEEDELAKLWSRGTRNFAGCVWARLDGKSPVEYLSDEKRREQIRALAREVFAAGESTWNDVLERARSHFAI
jgi:5-methylthioribose kinase